MSATVADPSIQANDKIPSPERRIPGEEGLWVFLLGDMAIFALFFGAIVVLHGQHPAMVIASQHALHPLLGLLNTGFLLTGSLFVVLATRAIRNGSSGAAGLYGGAIACGIGFAAVKAVEYASLIRDGHTAQSNDFFMYYFVFTGIHLGHLLIGLVLLTFLLTRARKAKPLTPGQRVFVDCGACYWHMVDLLWLALFPLLYLVR
ncbi:MAG: cytochrome oxidase subunit [Marmoricola sp.]|nr:cytochrome oxidase subunit [Marmoricola sp.]